MTVHRAGFGHGLLVKHRYFVALTPSSDATNAVRRHMRDAGVQKRNAPDRLHLTLFVSDDFETEPDGLAETMAARLDCVRDDAFDISLSRFGRQGDTLVPGSCRSLRRFQSQVVRVLTAGGVASRMGWAFDPHVTLGYGNVSTAICGKSIEPIVWRALEFELVHSLLRLTIHRTLGRWSLTEQPRLL